MCPQIRIEGARAEEAEPSSRPAYRNAVSTWIGFVERSGEIERLTMGGFRVSVVQEFVISGV